MNIQWEAGNSWMANRMILSLFLCFALARECFIKGAPETDWEQEKDRFSSWHRHRYINRIFDAIILFSICLIYHYMVCFLFRRCNINKDTMCTVDLLMLTKWITRFGALKKKINDFRFCVLIFIVLKIVDKLRRSDLFMRLFIYPSSIRDTHFQWIIIMNHSTVPRTRIELRAMWMRIVTNALVCWKKNELCRLQFDRIYFDFRFAGVRYFGCESKLQRRRFGEFAITASRRFGWSARPEAN